MFTRRVFVTFLAAGLLGLIAALSANRWMQNRMSAMAASEAGGAPVVVAAAEISFGEKITAAQLKTIVWPAGSVPEGTFRDVNEVAGQMANQKIIPGELVLRQRIAQQVDGNSLSTLVEPSKRAVSVRVNDVIGVAGFLLPGNRVDVLATRTDNERRAATRTLLQNVKVLAVDQTAQTDKDKPVVVRAVTLELDPQQAELLVQATEEGTVQLALRNPDDTAITMAPEQPAPVAVSQAPARKPAPSISMSTVTVIRETRMGTSEVRP